MRLSYLAALLSLSATTAFGRSVHIRDGPTSNSTSTPVVQHMVWFELKDAVNSTEVINRLFALKDSVTWNGRKIIQELRGGYQSSTEGYAKGLQIGAVLTFANEADCLWYTYNATAHQDFIAYVKPMAYDTVVLDFTDIANNVTKSS